MTSNTAKEYSKYLKALNILVMELDNSLTSMVKHTKARSRTIYSTEKVIVS
jgi:hypothetical protein